MSGDTVRQLKERIENYEREVAYYSKEIAEYKDESDRRERLIVEITKEINSLRFENKKLNLIRLTLEL